MIKWLVFKAMEGNMADVGKKNEAGFLSRVYNSAASFGDFLAEGGLLGLAGRKATERLADSAVARRIEGRIEKKVEDNFIDGATITNAVPHSKSIVVGMENRIEDFVASRITQELKYDCKALLSESDAERRKGDLEWLANKVNLASDPNPILSRIPNGPLGHFRDSLMLPTPKMVTNGVDVSDHAGAPGTPGHAAPKSDGKTKQP